jgi:hypothetical protein
MHATIVLRERRPFAIVATNFQAAGRFETKGNVMQAIRLLIVVLGMIVGANIAAAQDYPTRPIMMIQPTAAGDFKMESRGRP